MCFYWHQIGCRVRSPTHTLSHSFMLLLALMAVCGMVHLTQRSCTFLEYCCLLRPAVTIATSCLFFQRFYCEVSFAKYDCQVVYHFCHLSHSSFLLVSALALLHCPLLVQAVDSFLFEKISTHTITILIVLCW